ncbi:DUF3810 family protein [Alkalibaculum sp. M08DMB]|uniref:DUF3810 family protein n=1 Tax=Alkalibaculum sporogenes TaxID=2655001 RepID=A0A6A7KA83_9FIRM|nr:DUF3810 domain-containing protein [Alkalibaculum sporogenes]MPW26097.1 DUF3810 family protein [Alkalibaculum sporogenes]
MEATDIKLNSKQQARSISGIWRGTLIYISIAFITFILTRLAPLDAEMVEKLFSSTLYPYIAKFIGFISNIIPISLTEILIIMLFLLIIVMILLLLFNPKIYINNKIFIINYILRSLALVYILFYFLWGFNYFRPDYIDLANMNKDSGTIEDLETLSLEIINNMNIIRENLSEDIDGILLIEEDFTQLSRQAQKGFEDFKVGTLNLGGNYGQVKPILFSEWMSYTGIMGIFFAYTSEPNINTNIPIQDLLSTISHEIAHQRGFAKEDEANFIAYKANINNPDKNFQYSGYYLAIQYIMNDIYKEDQDLHIELFSKMSDSVKRDINNSNSFWKSKESSSKKIVTTMNDTYLKSNNQKQGVQSYNGVVKLLMSDYKSN